MNAGYFLGWDCSTQGLKAIIIDDQKYQITHEFSVNFQNEITEIATTYGYQKGVPDGDEKTVTTPTKLWILALEKILDKMKASRFEFTKIKALSGSGQQHGSVYWRKGSREILKNLNSDKGLTGQFENAFSVPHSPIWMDASTTKQCQQLEKYFNGPQNLTQETGSRAFERFTGSQIAKIFEKYPAAYQDTERISLVSSFVASLFLGDYAPIDWSDGSGMNLLNIETKEWSLKALEAVTSPTEAVHLATKLGEPKPSYTYLGNINQYFIKRYGFSQQCRIINFSGDNPCSVAGMMLKRDGDITISLGTSDTIFAVAKAPHPSLEHHIFANPLDGNSYMALICYKNGSLTREDIRNKVASSSWSKFNELLQKTPPGNNGNLGFYFTEHEILPHQIIGYFKFDTNGHKVDHFTPEVEVRAVIEHRALALKTHTQRLNIIPKGDILVTGGASSNQYIIQVIADVFGLPVKTINIPNSAALGAAFRAVQGWKIAENNGTFISFERALNFELKGENAIYPNRSATQIYAEILPKFTQLEKQLIAENSELIQ